VIEIHPHAYKHGLSACDIEAAFESGRLGGAMLVQDDDPLRWLIVGVDTTGRWIQVVAIQRPVGGYLIIHAMKATKATIDQLRQAREGR